MRIEGGTGLRARISRMGLGRQLALLGTVPILIGITVSLLALDADIRRQTKRLLQQAIRERHALIADVQQRRAEQRFRLFALVMDSPTLRAAMETYRVERLAGSEPRSVLAETIRAEATKAAATLDTGLLAILDNEGTVLALTGSEGPPPAQNADFSGHDIVRRALDPATRYSAGDFAVLDVDDEFFRISAVPIVLQDYILGALVVGDRLDEAYLQDLGSLLDGELLLTVDDEIVVSNLADRGRLDSIREALGQSRHGVLSAGGEEFVAAPFPLGTDGRGRMVAIHVLDSLTAALAVSDRTTRTTVIGAGAFALLLAVLAAWAVSRSIVRPLERFVEFMRDVTSGGDYSRRFRSPVAAREVRDLIEAYNTLSDSLLERTRDDMDQLERLKESEKLAALGRMLSGAAHEINNPLTGVVGNIEMVLHERHIDDRTRDRLETVRREGRRIVALVRSLLKVAHRPTEQRAVFDVHVPLRETVELRRHDFHAANLTLDLDLAPGEAPVYGNDLELQRAFLNVLNNAHDALVERGGPGRLVVGTRVDENLVSILFTDDGPGLADPQRVFEHFYTTKPVGKGTGLGMSITYATVKAHGGEVSAENVTSGGARFTIDLPRATAGAVPATPDAAGPAASDPHVKPLRAAVLVVDDEPGVLELQLAILDAFGATAVGAVSGTQAIEQLERRDFDLIVSDMKMPGGLSGKDLFRWVEENRPDRVRGFIFVTGDTIDEQEFLERDGRTVLSKPFTMDEYVAALRAALEALRRAA